MYMVAPTSHTGRRATEFCHQMAEHAEQFLTEAIVAEVGPSIFRAEDEVQPDS